MPEIGQVVGHLKLVEELGGEGLGVVHKAKDTSLGRLVTRKSLPDAVSRDRQVLERFGAWLGRPPHSIIRIFVRFATPTKVRASTSLRCSSLRGNR